MSELDSEVISGLLRHSLKAGKQPYVTVASNSMLPLLRRGDQIQLTDVPPEELQPGDIIVLGAPAELIVHRFWGLHRRDGAPGLLTKGDHLIHFDPSVPAAALIGRVIRRQREDRQLNLTDGIGRWLNQRLASVIALELRLLRKTPDSMNAEDQQSHDIRKVDSPGRRLAARLTHSLLYYVSIVLTLSAGSLAQTRTKD
jgi:signal peptidase I